MTRNTGSTYDVAIIGGGAAGLSAALTLGRSRRSVVLIDGGAPRNAPAHGVHSFLTREGIAPSELVAIGRAQLAPFDVTLVDSSVVASTGEIDDFRLELADASTVSARRVLVASGLVDELPAIDGLAERWGRDVIHCPFCHGWEVRDQVVGVLGLSPLSVHQALLFAQLSDQVVFFTHRHPVSEEQAEQLSVWGVEIVEGEVTGVEVIDDRITGVRLGDGRIGACAALAVTTRMSPRLTGLEGLGLAAVAHPSGAAEHLPVEAMGQTTTPGVFAAGNVADPMAQVVVAAGQGLMAGAAIHGGLMMADTARAIEARQHDRMWSAEFWDERYASAERVWSGRPNQRLVEQAAGLTPGRALEVGCGEGADAIWLAQQGWRVTGVDVSQVALDKASAHAETLGVAEATDWHQTDVLTWSPEPVFDLVSAQFMHVPSTVRDTLFTRLAAGVRPGGSFLVVGHDFSDTATTIRRPHHHDLYFTAADIAALLAPGDWRIVCAESQQRETTGPEGEPVTIADAVLHAVRLR